MKKLLLTILIVLLSFSVVFASDIRSMGMGGDHVADNADIYTLRRNPAGLGSTGNHLLLPLGITANIGGPLQDGWEFIDSHYINPKPDQNNDDIATEIIKIVEKNNGLDLSLNLEVPLFAFTNNGFGMGIFTNVTPSVAIPSVSYAEVNAELKASAIVGYGKKIKLPIGSLSLGFSAEGSAVVPKFRLTNTLVGLLGDVENLMTNLPSSNIYSYTINGGAQFDLWNFVTVGATWNNIISGSYQFNNANIGDAFAFDTSGTPIEGKFDQTVALGARVNLPTFFTLGIINSWNVYLDHENVLDLLPQKTLKRNPVLGFGFGTEAQILKFLSVRAGIKESYLSLGLGIKLGMINIEAAAYGKELGIEPGSRPQMNAAISVSLKK